MIISIKLETAFPNQVNLSEFQQVKIYYLNNVLQVCAVRHKSNGNQGAITRLSRTHYRDNRTGEVLEYQTHSIFSNKTYYRWRRKFENLYRLVNFNFHGNSQELFITLTFRETVDHPTAQKEFKKFAEKLLYHYNACNYIAIPEPNTDAGWHIHLLLCNPAVEIFQIPNQRIEELWGHGFTKTNRIFNANNLAKYFIASCTLQHELAENCKSLHKGSRLSLYPSGHRFPWKSKGILTPEPEELSGQEAMKVLNGLIPDYTSQTTISGVDEQGSEIILNVIVKLDYTLTKRSKR